MPEASFFADLSIVIAVAAAVGLLFSRFSLPLTVGYILAGIIVGPNIPPALISHEGNIRMLSDLGVMFLMFSIGLGFSFRQARRLGGAVILPAFWDVAFSTLGGYLLGQFLGWTPMESFLLGLIICDSSTSIAAKTLGELGWLRRRFAQNTFAIALIEDVLAILLIAVLNGLGPVSGAGGDTLPAVAGQLGTLALFLIGVIIFGVLFAPRLMNHVTDRYGDETVLLSALGICCGISYIAQEGLGLSLAVGAFLAGAIIAEARARRRIERVVQPITNLFAAVFFVSVGLTVNPAAIWQNIWIILPVTMLMILLKLINCTVGGILVGEAPKDAFKTGIAMGQVAEFSFIIAALAHTNGLSDLPLYQIAVGTALLCTATNPWLLKYSDRLYSATAKYISPSIKELLPLYRHRLETLRHQASGATLLTRLRNHALIAGINLSVAAILTGGIRLAASLPPIRSLAVSVDEAWQPLTVFGIRIPFFGLLLLTAALLLTAPVFWAAWHNWIHIVHLLTEDTLPDRWSRRLIRVRRFLQTCLKLIGLYGLWVYAAILLSGLLGNRTLLLTLLVFAAALVARFSKRIRAGYQRSHRILIRAFDVNELPKTDPATMEAIIAVHTETVVLPPDAACAGKTLGELKLRFETGASVVSVSGSAGMNVSPGSNTRLLAGDALVIVGSDSELANAAERLTRRIDETGNSNDHPQKHCVAQLPTEHSKNPNLQQKKPR